VLNGNGLGQRSGTVRYEPCKTLMGWVRGQGLSGITVHNGNGRGQRSGIVWYVPCVTVMIWVRGQVLSAMYRA